MLPKILKNFNAFVDGRGNKGRIDEISLPKLSIKPVGAIVGGIAIATTLVVTNWESVKSFFMTIWEPIKPVWKAFSN